MLATNRHLFVSYSRQDLQTVTLVIDALREEYRLRSLDIDIWVDVKDLRPGQQWSAEIERALNDSVGLLVFVSRASMESSWVRQELLMAELQPDRFIIPVILEHVPKLPAPLRSRQWLDLSERRSGTNIHEAAQQIANTTEHYLRSTFPRSPVSPGEASEVAATIAQEVRGEERRDDEALAPPRSVFIVHGHDDTALGEVDEYLTGLGITTITLSTIGGAAQSLFQKFLQFSADVRFAIVVFTADDLGASRLQYESDGVGDKALQFRARQNVILELGFFYGYLGWENVFVVYRSPNKVFPNFERPSDLDGVIFDTIDATGQWRDSLRQRLTEAGFQFDGSI